MSKFAKCFPGADGTMVCMHWNGNWIVFPINRQQKTRHKDELGAK